MKKALVTGANGFIGSALTQELSKNNVDVIAMVRNPQSNIERIKRLSNVSIIYCDLEHISDLPRRISDRDVDVLYHLAWEGASGVKRFDHTIQIKNIQAAADLLETASVLNVKKFIGAGSLHEKECELAMQKPGDFNDLTNIYKCAKMAAHCICRAKASALNIDFLWPIITNAYGVGERSSRLINTLIRKVMQGEKPSLSTGDQYYDFIYITDVAKAFYLLGKLGLSNREYMIGSGNPQPLKEFLIELRDIVNENTPLDFGAHHYDGIYLDKEVFNIGNLIKDTGFYPEIDFRNGILTTLNWIRNRDLPGCQ